MPRFTADRARTSHGDDLDERIEYAVRNNRTYENGGPGAYMRIYHDDPWRYRLEQELEDRGFKNVDVPSFTLKTDVYFEWDE